MIKYSTLGNATIFLYKSYILSFEVIQVDLQTQILILLSMYNMYHVYFTKAEF